MLSQTNVIELVSLYMKVRGPQRCHPGVLVRKVTILLVCSLTYMLQIHWMNVLLADDICYVDTIP